MRQISALLIFLAYSITTAAQSITNYQFAATSGTFTALSGGNTMALSGGNTDDGWFNAIPIGFTFYYMGVPYTVVSTSTKGWMTFGQNISNAAYTNALASGGTRPLLAPLWDDNDIQANTNFSYLTSGTSPNRIFTAEWMNVKWKNSATAGGISFQVKLYEANGKVEFIYHPEAGATASPSASIGITSSATGSGNYLSLNNATASPTVSSTSETTSISTKPADGQVYSFSPPSVSLAAPVNMTFTDITMTGMTVNWTDNSTNETFFTVYFSYDGINYSPLGTVASTTTAGTGTAYSISKTGLLPGVTYYYRVNACVEGNGSPFLSGSQSTTAPAEITSIASGNWTATSTWSTGTVPTSFDNVTIADGDTVIIDGTATCNSLTVGQGASGILRFGTVAATMTVIQGVTVATGGSFIAGAAAGVNLTHTLKIGGAASTDMGTGNLTVNGTFDMYIGSSNGKCTVTFFGIPEATISGTGATLDFYRVVLNKGATTATTTVTPPILNINRNWTGSGSSTAGFLYTHTAGTVKIGGTNTFSNPLYISTSPNIPALGGIWLANPNFTLTLAGSPDNNGLLRLTNGILNIGSAAGNAMGAAAGAVFMIENDTMNIAGRLNTANAVNWIQSGGTVKVTTKGNSTSNAPGFGLTNSGSAFTMSGGTICLVLANTTTSVKIDYYNNAGTTNITGGLLQLGNANSGSTAKTYYIRGTAPNVSLTNTSANHSCNLAGNLLIRGDLVLNGTGTFSNNSNSLTMAGMNSTYPGNITVNADAVLTLNTGPASMLSFTGSFGNQSLINSGAITSNQLAGLTVANTFGGSGTVTIPSGLTLTGDATLNLEAGTLNCGTGITAGTGGTTGFTYIRGNGSISGTMTRNYGSGTVNYTYNGTNAQSTGAELPSSITGTFTIDNPAGVTMSSALQSGKFTLTSGTLGTTGTNLLTITGTAATDLTYSAGQVNGPIERILPANLATGTVYLFPVGKSAYRPLELVDPVTGGGTVTIRAEVFDAPTGGMPGSTMVSLNNNRYWYVTAIAGGANLTGTKLRITEEGLTSNSGIAKSATLAGTYDLVSILAPSGNTLMTGTMNSLSYYVTGEKRMNYVSSTATQGNTTYVREGSVNQEIIGMQIVTNGSLDPALATSFTFNTNGTTRMADLANAKVFYTGTSSTYTTTNQFGSTFTGPSGSFTITGSQALAEGTNYFWLAYDIAMGVIDNDLVDAEFSSVTVRGVAYAPTVQAPTGNRTVRAALTGNITVGTSGSYPTLTGSGGLFEKIALVGLKGNVTALIVSDITEPATNVITQWYEAGGSGYTLTISPDAAAMRTISGSYAGGLLRLSNVSRVTLDGRYGGSGKYLNIINSATTGTIAALQLIGTAAGQGCTYITVRNCNLATGHSGSTSYGVALSSSSPGSAGYDHDQVTIRECNISKATYGIYADANSSGLYDNLVIAGDSVGSNTSGSEVTRCGIYVSRCPGVQVNGNRVFNILNASNETRGLFLGPGCINSTVSANHFNGIKSTAGTTYGSTGIFISPNVTGANVNLINNIVTNITATGSNNIASAGIAGIKIYSGTGINLYYNSVNLTGNVSHAVDGDNSTAIYFISTGNIVMKNNIFRNAIVNTAASAYAYAIYTATDKTAFTLLDYNDYIPSGSQGTRLGYCNSSIASTIYEWRTISSQDPNSISAEPVFTSATDLHVDYSSPARNAATPVAGITVDFENVVRNASTPTIGALETPRDGLGPVITYNPLGKTSSLSARPLVATITDSTGVPVSGPGMPVLYWNINRGSWSAVTSVYLGNSQYQFTFGAGVTYGDSVFYFIAAQDTWTTPNVATRPAEGAGGFTINPPGCSTKPTNPEVYRIAYLVSGNFTVGATGQFPTLTGAGGFFNYINANVLNGNVRGSIISDLTEPGTFGLNEWAEQGTGNYTVTVGPDGTTERIISGSTTSGMIRLEGADRVMIDGRHGGTGRYLRFRNTSTAASATIHLLNGATHDTIRNCHLEGASDLSASGVVHFGTSTVTEGNSFNGILDNMIRESTAVTKAEAPMLPVNCIYSYGTTSRRNASNSITGNEIFNFVNYGILIASTGNGGMWNITGNSLYNNLETPPSTLQRAISIQAGVWSGFNVISGNYIGGQAAQCGGSPWVNTSTSSFAGILLNASGYDYSTISFNVIRNISLTNTSGGELNAIYITGGSAHITDNVIGDADTAHTLRSSSRDFNRKLTGIRITSDSYFNQVTGNTITNLVLTGTTGYPEASGIDVYAADIVKNKVSGIGYAINTALSPYINGIKISGNPGAFNDIINNQVILDGGASADAEIYGIYEDSYDENSYNIYYNSISISGPGNSSAYTYAIYRTSMAAFTMKNNVLANFRNPSTGSDNYSFYPESEDNITSDYNDLYCPNGYVGYYNYTPLATLAEWQSASLQDAHSLGGNPLFVNNISDLHPATGSPLGSAGIGLEEVADDIDGNLRDPGTPTIGCYEAAITYDKTWNGSVSANWNNASNWIPAGVPSSTNNVMIPASTPYSCTVNASGMACRYINIASSASLSIPSPNSLTAFGTMTIQNGGTLTNNGTLILKGSLVNLNETK